MIALTLAFALSAPSQAQMFRPTICYRAIGAAVGYTPDRRDWDFTTPGPYGSPSSSPDLSQLCEEDARFGLRTYIGLDVVPTYQHSYAALGDRAPMLVEIDWGISKEIGYHTSLGLQVVTNGLAVGIGARWVWSWRTGMALRRGPEIRLNVLSGNEPDVQAELLWRFPAKQVLAMRDPADGPDEYWHRPHLTAGFEFGTVMGVRARLGLNQWGFGARIGETTAWRAHVALQPTGLGYVEVPLGGATKFLASGGLIRRDNAFMPIAGAALGTRGKILRAQAGVLFGQRYLTPDIGLSMMW